MSQKLNQDQTLPLDFNWPTDNDLSEMVANMDPAELANVQISGIENNVKLCKFNFVLSNGWRSTL